ncbi:MAG: hypothetical protein MOB07_31385 [Acidobacteria bacterium]|nr:hypothetical protein [Acidobacteriota bacterium]
MKKPNLTLEETQASVRALAQVIDQTATQINSKQRQSLVRAVMKTIAPTKAGSRKNRTKRAPRRSGG